MANRTSGAFTATGASAAVSFDRGDMSIWGTFVATIEIQKSFDGGTTWHDIEDGSFTAPTDKIVDSDAENVMYRLNVSAFTSGTISYFLGSLASE